MVQLKIMRSEQLKEHFIIEVQGQIISRHNNGLSGNHFGDLHFTKQGEPLLIIGHHIIPGKVEELEKPFACMRKVNGDGGVRYEVEAVIKKRILFKKRPKPIILLNKK